MAKNARRSVLLCAELSTAEPGNPNAMHLTCAQHKTVSSLCPAGRQYALTYRPDSRKCYVLLKQGASPQSVAQVRAAAAACC